MNFVVLDIGGTAIKYNLYCTETGFASEIPQELPTEAMQGGSHILQQIRRILNQYSDIQGIGISSAGQIDATAGTVLFANDNLPGFTGMRLKELLEAEYQVPVVVENDVNAAALGEAAFGAGRTHPDFLCLAYGTGIGGAIVQEGAIYHGDKFGAGEFGHLVTHGGGEPCSCGMRGCYEAYASTKALLALVKARHKRSLTGREVFAALPHDPALQETLQIWMTEILYGLASLVHVFNPSCIVLGGGIMEQVSIVHYLAEQLPHHISENYRQVTLVPAALGNAAGLYGMVSLLLQEQKEERL